MENDNIYKQLEKEYNTYKNLRNAAEKQKVLVSDLKNIIYTRVAIKILINLVQKNSFCYSF